MKSDKEGAIMNDVNEYDIFAPIESDLESFTNIFTMSPELWKKFYVSDLELLGLDFSRCEKIKLIENGKFTNEIKRIPTNVGGIYIYSIEPMIINSPITGSYVMYIGKATKTQSENLRKRIQSYHKYLSDDERPRLHRLFSKWGDYVYVTFLPIDLDDSVITTIEDRLIAAFGKPPCNADVRIKSVGTAVKAYN